MDPGRARVRQGHAMREDHCQVRVHTSLHRRSAPRRGQERIRSGQVSYRHHGAGCMQSLNPIGLKLTKFHTNFHSLFYPLGGRIDQNPFFADAYVITSTCMPNFSPIRPVVIIYFEASPETLTKRLIGRAASSGRADDNEETIKLRIKTFLENNDQVLAQYPAKIKRTIKLRLKTFLENNDQLPVQYPAKITKMSVHPNRVLTKRLLGRVARKGRADDIEETIKLRLKTFLGNNDQLPVQYPAKITKMSVHPIRVLTKRLLGRVARKGRSDDNE
ncbi:unnamed protein product [Chilo suppressalis]|uniref:40S ribosomal protein S7 n=1 Tax=Chilo suppressalis TaxID=168631 RepID=A0ABN8B5I1_CHISP|nr:unnamed protein product [Chilo suppressalis]